MIKRKKTTEQNWSTKHYTD